MQQKGVVPGFSGGNFSGNIDWSVNTYIHESLVTFVRRLYLSYHVLLAGLYITIEGFSILLQLFYSFRFVELHPDTYPTWRTAIVQICVTSLIVLLVMLISSILVKCWELLYLIWRREQYQVISRRMLSFLRLKADNHRFLDIFFQLFLVIIWEVVPILAALIATFVTIPYDLIFGFKAFLSFGSLAALVLVLAWWLTGQIANYKRMIFCCLRNGKSFHDRVNNLEEEPPLKQATFDDDVIISAKLNTIIGHDGDKGDEHKAHIIKQQRDVFVLGYLFCCWLNVIRIPLPCKSFFPVLYLKLKHLWVVAIFLLLFIGVIVSGVLNFWTLFSVVMVGLGCWIIDVLLDRIFFIPRHRIDKDRIKATWNQSNRFWFASRWVAIVEEIYFHSPAVIYSVCKMTFYTSAVVVTVCLSFRFYRSFAIFFISMTLSFLICVLYILRFNLLRIYQKQKRIESTYGQDESIQDETSHLIAEEIEPSFTDPNKGHHLHVPFESEILRILSVFSYTGTILVLIVVLFVLNIISVGFVPGLIFLALIISVSSIIFKRFEKQTAQVWNFIFYLFVLIMSGVFLIGSLKQEPVYDRNYATTGVHFNLKRPRYPICRDSWYDFTVVDYGMFSFLAYEQSPYLDQDFKTWFPKCKNCTVKRFSESVTFLDIHVPDKNLSVLAIRGTDTYLDLIQDFILWKEIVLLQACSYFGPFLSVWPTSLTIDIIGSISKLESFLMERYSYDLQNYYVIVNNYIRELRKIPGRKIILCGHSLGGGISSLLGSMNGIESINFSAPGIVYVSRKFRITLEQINQNTININPRLDIVPQVDTHGGLTQRIQCPLQDPFTCHKMGTTLKTMIQDCGNSKLGRYVKE